MKKIYCYRRASVQIQWFPATKHRKQIVQFTQKNKNFEGYHLHFMSRSCCFSGLDILASKTLLKLELRIKNCKKKQIGRHSFADLKRSQVVQYIFCAVQLSNAKFDISYGKKTITLQKYLSNRFLPIFIIINK